MPGDPPPDDDEYASSEDSDFLPENDAAAAPESDDFDSDVEPEKQKTLPAKRAREDDAAGEGEGSGLDNSGDEALIDKAKKKQKKKKKRRRKDGEDGDEAEGGEGGLVMTRSMRAAEKAEKKQTAAFGPVTIDVDALWAQMKAGKAAAAPPQDDATANKPAEQPDTAAAADAAAAAPEPTKTSAADPPDMVRIKRKYNFAGKVHTEEKLVPRDSAEAKLYLESVAPDDSSTSPTRPAPRRAFRSAFEPALEPHQRRGDLNLGVAARLKAREAVGAEKLNTVEKSRMDWAGFVDREGIKDELEAAGRSKGSYVEREGFLARSEARREEDARRARVSAMG